MTTPSKLRAITYRAVSTEEQADPNLPSLSEQDATTEAFCKAQGWPIVAKVCIDGHSRYYTRLDKMIDSCPEYGQLIDLIESRAGDIVVATDYDRFWRTDALRAQLAAISREHGVKLYAINQPVPLDNDVSSFWLELIFGGTAQQENWTRVERFRRGYRGKVKSGLAAVTSRTPYGYRKAGKREPLVIVPEQAEWVRWIYDQRVKKGRGYTIIANELNERGVPSPKGGQRGWSHTTVRYILNNPFYCGIVTYNEWNKSVPVRCPFQHSPERSTRGEGKHEPLVSREVWEAARAINTRHRRETKAIQDQTADRREGYILSGLLRCGFCGYSMTYSRTKSTYTLRSGEKRVYRYTAVRCVSYIRSHGATCQNNYHVGHALHDYVREAIKREVNDRLALARANELSEKTDRRQERVAGLRAEIRDIERRLNVWYDALESGQFSVAEVAKRQRDLIGRREDRQRELDDLLQESENQSIADDRWRSFAHLGDAIDNLPPQELRAAALILIESITLKAGEPPRIEWQA